MQSYVHTKCPVLRPVPENDTRSMILPEYQSERSSRQSSRQSSRVAACKNEMQTFGIRVLKGAFLRSLSERVFRQFQGTF